MSSINKNNTTLETIGLSKKNFQKWISFNLNLDNIDNDYHLDHFNPLSLFECKTMEDIIITKCNHWTNIRPMLSIDNIKKSNKVPSLNEKIKMDIRIYIFNKILNNKI